MILRPAIYFKIISQIRRETVSKAVSANNIIKDFVKNFIRITIKTKNHLESNRAGAETVDQLLVLAGLYFSSCCRWIDLNKSQEHE
jgi:hypothetical protein